MTDPDWSALEAAWQPARRAGALGSPSIEELLSHAAGYLPAACRVEDPFSGIDVGTGAGVPGVLLAALRPASVWVLVDASERRCEYAASAVRSLDIADRVRVVHARAEEVAHDPAHRGSYDLVVARSFGPPAEVAECALPLAGRRGVLVISVVEATRRQWQHAAVDIGVRLDQPGADAGYLQVTPPAEIPANWPRRPPARRRAPLF